VLGEEGPPSDVFEGMHLSVRGVHPVQADCADDEHDQAQ
jgi:hypothetical protein